MLEYDPELDNAEEVIRAYELKKLTDPIGNGDAPPCVDAKGPTKFFNTEHVKKALHVDTDVDWSMCNTYISVLYKRSKTGTIGLYPNLIKEGLRIWFYSGDVDGAVPTSGSLYWYNKLNKEQNY